MRDWQERELSNEPGSSGVYRAEPFTKESCNAFAEEFPGRQGAEIKFGSPDVNYYDNSAAYSDHRTYSLWVEYKDRSYRYIDYRVDSELLTSDKGGTITENELRDALGKLGIAVPEAWLAAKDGEKAGTHFRRGVSRKMARLPLAN